MVSIQCNAKWNDIAAILRMAACLSRESLSCSIVMTETIEYGEKSQHMCIKVRRCVQRGASLRSMFVMMKKIIHIAVVIVIVFIAAADRLQAQASISPTTGYSQNFDTLTGSGAAGTLLPWRDNTTIPGWYAYKNRAITGSPIGPPANYFLDDGSSSTGGDGLRSYGSLSPGQTNAPTDRALGEYSSTLDSLIFSFAVRLVNATGAPVASLMVAYRGEQWRQNTGTTGLVCDYQIGASSISTGTWTPVTALDFPPPKNGLAGPLDGNAAGNAAFRSAEILAPLALGQEIWIRWTKQGTASCGLAIDDLSVQTPPAAQPTLLQFSSVTSTSMNVSFTAASPAPTGYVVFRKIGSAPASVPVNGAVYAAGDMLGDATVASSGTLSAFSQSGLVPNTLYYYTVFSFNGTGATTTYRTSSPLSGSRSTTAGNASVGSDVAAVSASETSTISSLFNDAAPLSSSTGVQVWKVSIRDGGSTGDGDLKPTIVTGITLRQAGWNTAPDWSNTIQAADLFAGSARIAGGTVTATAIEFTLSHLIVPDNGSATLTLRSSLKNSGLTDHQTLQFSLVSADVRTESDSTSSQMTAGVSCSSDETKNRIDVAASKLRFFQQPTDVALGRIMAPPAAVEAVDANNNRDADVTSGITMTASGATLAGTPIASAFTAGYAAFSSLSFSTTGTSVTLTAASNNWAAVSNPFLVAAHRTFFVDSMLGSDASSGMSQSSAWKTLGKVNGNIFEPGDSILFRSGRSWTGQVKPKGSGSNGLPIVIGSYGGAAKPVISGGGITGEAVVYLNNQEYWEITNLEITNDAAVEGDRRGVLITASNFGVVDHIYVKNLFIHNIKGIIGDDNSAKRTAGIGFEVTADAAVPTRFNDVWIDSCTIANVDNTGLYTDNTASRSDYPNTVGWQNRKYTNLRVTNSVFHHISKNAMIIRLAQGGVIEHNVCYETATGTTGNTMFTASCDGTVFQYNEGYLNRASLQGGDFGDGSMYDADLQSINCVFQYSYSHDNSHGLFWTCTVQQDTGNVCRYNVSRNDKGFIFCINYPVTSVSVYNNTVYCNSTALSPTFISERNVISGIRKYYFYNNIIYNLSPNAKPYEMHSSYTRVVDRNLFYGFHPVNEPVNATPLAVDSSDPLFVDAQPSVTTGWKSAVGFALKQGSPAIDNAVMIAGQPGKDYAGNPVPNAGGAVDRGAFEYQASTSVPQRGGSLPSRFMLEQNFPNPFNPSTEIRYSIPDGGAVRLTVYNILGQEVAVLADGYRNAGSHSVTFSGAQYSSGIYICTLTSGAFSDTKRIVLEK